MNKEIWNSLPKAGSGLYNADGSFESATHLKKRLATEGKLPVYDRDPKKPRKLTDFLNSAEQRSKDMKDTSSVSEGEIGIQLPETSTVNFIGDLHFGHQNTNNKRIEQEVETIKNADDNYVGLMGDLVDGIFWGGASQGENASNISEQHGFLRSLFKELKGKILFAVSGEHDSKWASKTGSDPYDLLTEETGAPYTRGVAEVKISAGDQEYKVVAQHKARGHSMYNKNHPTYRNARFNVQGADVYVSAHNHQKQVSQETVREFGGAREVTHVAVGPYKTHDEYGDRSGFIPQKEGEMYGASVRLHADKRKVDVEPDILEAIRKWSE